MTAPEHCIFGAVLSHLGFHQRHGTRITVVMIVASIVPDVEGLAFFFGRDAFVKYHRSLTHSFGGIVFASVGMAVLCAVLPLMARGLAGEVERGGRFRELLAAVAASRGAGNCLGDFPLMFVVSLLAMAGHLLVDVVYPWSMPLFWPFSRERVVYAVVNWGDKGVLVIMLATMFALGLIKRRRRVVALTSVGLLCLYLFVRSVSGFSPEWLSGVPR